MLLHVLLVRRARRCGWQLPEHLGRQSLPYCCLLCARSAKPPTIEDGAARPGAHNAAALGTLGPEAHRPGGVASKRVTNDVAVFEEGDVRVEGRSPAVVLSAGAEAAERALKRQRSAGLGLPVRITPVPAVARHRKGPL